MIYEPAFFWYLVLRLRFTRRCNSSAEGSPCEGAAGLAINLMPRSGESSTVRLSLLVQVTKQRFAIVAERIHVAFLSEAVFGYGGRRMQRDITSTGAPLRRPGEAGAAIISK